MSLKALIPAALIVAGTAAPSLAQVVGTADAVNGGVVVTRGTVDYAATNTGSIMAGDCITATANSSAIVSTVNGCSITVSEGQSVLVTDAADCSATFTTQANSCYIPADAAVSSLAPGGFGAMPLLPVLVGIGVVAAAVVAIEDEDPVSP